MRKRRAEFANIDFTQSMLKIPGSLAERLRHLKQVHGLKRIDNVISAMIRKAILTCNEDEFELPPPLHKDDKMKVINVHIPREHHAYLERIAHKFRGVTLGVALETIAANVSDLTPAPKQLSLIGEDLP